MPAALSVFTLKPVLVERPWGGRALEQLGKELPAGVAIGESWEVADLPSHVAPHVVDPRSRVAAGPLEGRSLSELIDLHGTDLMGSAPATQEGNFPLLVKLLDAAQHLSVQVHPHAQYVENHPDARLKTESWYVIRASDGAELFLDLRTDATMDQVRHALGSTEFVRLLRRVEAVPGEFHHLPAGLVHALGAGVVVAEVQTPSDTTFRIYDWSEEYRREPRAMHFEEALETLVIDPPGVSHIPAADGPGVRELERNPNYWIREHRSDGGRIQVDPDPEVRVVMAVEGSFRIGDLDLPPGRTAVIPAVLASECQISSAGGTLLEVGLVG